MTLKHNLVRADRLFWHCQTCTGFWVKPPKSTCPGVLLFLHGTPVPDNLLTRTALRRAGLVLPAGAPRAAVVENAYHQRFALFRAEQATQRRKASPAQRDVLAHARSRLGTCARCGDRPDCTALVRRKDYLGPCKELPEDRVCLTCYGDSWDAAEDARIEEVRASHRASLGRTAVLDFETTSLSDPSAIEVAMWGPEGLLYHSLIDPGEVRWCPEARQVHRLGPGDVAGEKSWIQVEAELARVIIEQGIDRLASWGSYDSYVVWTERNRHREEGGWPVEWVNLMDLFDIHLRATRPRFWRRGLARPGRPPMTSLTRACARYRVPPGAHRASSDAAAAWAVYLAMLVSPGGSR